MTDDGETLAALKRAGTRAVYHLLRAGIESLKAVEAVIDELGTIGKEPPAEGADETRTRIELE